MSTAKWRATQTALVVGVAMLVALFALCQVAYASMAVTGTDYYGNGAITEGSVDVLSVEGESSDTLYIQVQKDGRIIGDRVAYQFGMSDNSKDGSATAAERGGVVSLDISNLDLSGSSTYTVTAYADRDETQQLYSGTIYGVYAKLSDGSRQLIGVHTGAANQAAEGLSFQPSEKLYLNNTSYALDSKATAEVTANTITYSYSAYNEETTANGKVRFVDTQGQLISETEVAGVGRGQGKTVEVPAIVTKEVDGTTYYFRTVYFANSVTLSNPGQLSYTITCKLVGQAESSAAGYYKAVIRAVDQNGGVVFTDTASITGDYYYTMPKVVYKQESGKVYTYTLSDESQSTLKFTTDPSTTGAVTRDVVYTRSSTEGQDVTVTYNLIDGTKTSVDGGRNLGTTTVKLSEAGAKATPEANIEVNGKKYTIAGSVDDYAYTLGSTTYPVINAYYTPEGYVPSNGEYTVTVNYVNFLTNEVIKSESFQSKESDNLNHSFTSAESFTQGNVTYVRLAGQESAISHSYYSGIQTYTVYYRDVNDTLTSGTVINTIRVVYTDGTEGTTTNTGTTNNGSTTTTTTAAGTTAAGTGATAANAATLNANGTYNVFDGEGNNQTLTNEEGVDSNTERIDDNETPLAQAPDSPGGEASQGMPAWAVPLGAGIAALAAAAGLVFIFTKRRKDNDGNQEQNA